MVAFKLIRNGFFITSRNLLKQLPGKILAHLKLPKNRFCFKNLNGYNGINEELFNRHRSSMMPFVTVPGLKGKVYVPEKPQEIAKKHPCRDCYFCQSCSDDRCRMCLGPKDHNCRKSVEE